jgi:hypothetical protein
MTNYFKGFYEMWSCRYSKASKLAPRPICLPVIKYIFILTLEFSDRSEDSQHKLSGRGIGVDGILL